jgi:arylsulfatase A-like enzyme
MKLLRPAILGLFFGLVVAGFFNMTREKKPRPNLPNILYISVDTLRADHLGLYGYERQTSPNLDEFFGQGGTVFERAYATCTHTPPSVYSFLTGYLPQNHHQRVGYQKIRPEVVLVHEKMKDLGYQSAGFIANILLTEEASGLETRFDYYDDYVLQPELYQNNYERDALFTTDAVLRWFHQVRDPKRPHFAWVHYMDPHGPYAPPPEKPVTFKHDREPMLLDPEKIPAYQKHEGMLDGWEYVDLYDEEIAFNDQEIGRLLDAYEKEGILDNTIVIFTSDHGETLLDRPEQEVFRHCWHVYEEMIHVPLMIRGPGFEQARRVDVNVSNMDVPPTLLELLDLPVPEDMDGESLLSPRPGRLIFAESAFPPRESTLWRAVVQDKKKWVLAVWASEEKEIVHEWFFDLEEDPGEKDEKGFYETEASRKLREMIIADVELGMKEPLFRDGQRLEKAKLPPWMSQEEIDALQALGYLGGGDTGVQSEAGTQRPTPALPD